MKHIAKINISRVMMLFCLPYDSNMKLSASIDETLRVASLSSAR